VATLVSSFRKLRDTFTGLLEENRLLREENQHLREVLSECVEACARFVDHPQAEALHEGQEVDHARAWLALDTAKGVLAQPKQLGFVEERNANEPRTK
jgi:regulator of replication initiation timing